MNALRRYDHGPAVEDLQDRLIAAGFAVGTKDGVFGPKTESAVVAFQTKRGLLADGVVGPVTWGALNPQNFTVKRDGHPSVHALLGKPQPMTGAERELLFGRFKFEPAPTRDNPEGIRIIGDWEARSIVPVKVPQLAGVPVGSVVSKGWVRFHDKAVPQLLALFEAWERAGLIGRILTYDGAYNPRFVRGSRTVLSNHAWGTALDLNAQWNGLGARPAQIGQKGCLMELVPLAERFGFYWGGNFTRRDGMHFEVARLLSADELAQLKVLQQPDRDSGVREPAGISHGGNT